MKPFLHGPQETTMNNELKLGANFVCVNRVKQVHYSLQSHFSESF